MHFAVLGSEDQGTLQVGCWAVSHLILWSKIQTWSMIFPGQPTKLGSLPQLIAHFPSPSSSSHSHSISRPRVPKLDMLLLPTHTPSRILAIAQTEEGVMIPNNWSA